MARKGRTKGRAASRADRTSGTRRGRGDAAAPEDARPARRGRSPAADASRAPARPTHDPRANEPFGIHARLDPAESEALRSTDHGAGVRGGTRSLSRQGSRAIELDAQSVAELRPHVINLVQGRFSDRGTFTSTASDVEAIFAEHLPRWLAQAGRPARIVLFAHGGLVPERTGLGVAHKQHAWWLANGVYPIHFVWETGLIETLGQLIRTGGRRAARDLADWTSDPVIEVAAHFAGGPTIWGGMKRSAERAFDEEGAGHFALRRLFEMLGRTTGAVEIHLVGHSAGSIFVAHLLERAVALGGPACTTISLLAPAITIDEFRSRFMPHAVANGGRGFDRLAIFTMKRDLERADHCQHAYRKSLLYLIRNALEPEVPTEILGLEESIRRTPDVLRFLGLGASPAGGSAPHEVIWSTTESNEGSSASHSTAHGDFDDDEPTMNSVLRRVLDRPSAEIVSFPARLQGRAMMAGARSALDDGRAEVDARIRAELDARGIDPSTYRGALGGSLVGAGFSTGLDDAEDELEPLDGDLLGAATDSDWAVPESETGEALGAPWVRGSPVTGRRSALCIGIDRYRDLPLDGCVADARKWHELFRGLGFECQPLMLDEAATREAIVGAMGSLLRAAEPGDVIAVQYSGHGTQVDDFDGDEQGGDQGGGGAMPDDEPGRDEAIVPVDHERGAYVIDDDFAELFRAVAPGVNVTCFFDCCHSGTMNRLWPSRGPVEIDPTLKPRRLRLSEEQQRAHLAFRAGLTRSRGGGATVVHAARGVHAAGEIFFSACRADELAWESSGQGDFTRRALRTLASGVEGLTNEEFHRRVVEAFGSRRRQTPELHCADDRRELPLLGARLVAGAGAGRAPRPTSPMTGSAELSRGDRAAIAKSLQAIARRLA